MIAEGRLHVRVMTRKNRRLPRISKARLEEMIEQATVDAYNESEQITGWFTMIDENLAVPFETIDPQSAAERAGLKPGDLMTELDGTSARDAADLQLVTRSWYSCVDPPYGFE